MTSKSFLEALTSVAECQTTGKPGPCKGGGKGGQAQTPRTGAQREKQVKRQAGIKRREVEKAHEKTKGEITSTRDMGPGKSSRNVFQRLFGLKSGAEKGHEKKLGKLKKRFEKLSKTRDKLHKSRSRAERRAS